MTDTHNIVTLMTDLEWLDKNNACYGGEVAVEEAGGLVPFWKTTERGDWMLWLDTRISILTPEELKEFSRKCAYSALEAAEQVRHLMKDERSRNTLDVTRAFLDGKATLEELQGVLSARTTDAAIAAWYAAESAAASVGVLGFAAQSAESTAWSAAESAARSAAWSAAWSAVWSAESAAYARCAAVWSAESAARKQQADWLRENVSPERFSEALEKAKGINL